MIKQRIIRAITKRLIKFEQNIDVARQKKATQETVCFIENNFPNDIKTFTNKFDLLHYSLGQVKNEGLYLEFGVYSGKTINYIASNISQKIWGFDSFEGLPESWRSGFEKGAFARNNIPKVISNVNLVVGWFEKTLPLFLKKEKGNCAFIHIDCDLYSSTDTVFKKLARRIKKGTVIVFDDYFNYPGWENGEHKALLEYLKKSKRKIRYLGYNKLGEQVSLIIE